MCPKLTVVFSPSGGSSGFIQDVETEMRNFSNGTGKQSRNANTAGNNNVTPRGNPDFLDV
jgi:hypothetical protein